MQAKLSLIGFYNWDNTLFDDLVFPEKVDKDIAVRTILLECGEFEVLYPDFDFLKYAIKHFGAQHYWTFNKIFNAISIDYKPLENYNRTEIETIKNEKSNTQTNSGKDNTLNKETNSGSDVVNMDEVTGGEDVETPDLTKETNVSAYDSATYSPREQETTSGTNTTEYGKTIDTDSTTTYGRKTDNDSTTTYGKIVNDEGEENIERSVNAYGNIGVTTSQQMLQSEIDIGLYDAYKMIADIFADDLCVRTF